MLRHKYDMIACEHNCLVYVQHVTRMTGLQVASGPEARQSPLNTSEGRTGDLAACEVCSAKTSESNNWLHRLIKGREIDRNGRGGWGSRNSC